MAPGRPGRQLAVRRLHRDGLCAPPPALPPAAPCLPLPPPAINATPPFPCRPLPPPAFSLPLLEFFSLSFHCLSADFQVDSNGTHTNDQVPSPSSPHEHLCQVTCRHDADAALHTSTHIPSQAGGLEEQIGRGGREKGGAGGRRSEGFPIFAPPQQTVINSWSEVRRGALRPVNTAV